jgi:hypothetical protein
MERIINNDDCYLIRKEDVDKHLVTLGFKIPFLQMLGIIYMKKKSSKEDV